MLGQTRIFLQTYDTTAIVVFFSKLLNNSFVTSSHRALMKESYTLPEELLPYMHMLFLFKLVFPVFVKLYCCYNN